MASEFVTGSKILEITDYSAVEGITANNYIKSEHFTVGAYDWVIQFYPRGEEESVSNCVSVYVEVLNKTKQFEAIVSFCLWDSDTKKWSHKRHTSSPYTFSPPTRFGYPTYINRSDLQKLGYLRDDTLIIKCTLFVIVPRPAQKPDVNEEYPKWSKNSSKYGFHLIGYAPPNAPSDMYTGLPRQPTVRIYCQAIEDFSVTARNSTVVLAPTDPSDHYQHWIKDMSNGVTGLDYPVCALVNRVTGEALETPTAEGQPVSLVPYENSFKDLVNWTEVGSTGFRAIRTTKDSTRNMTAVAREPDKFNDGAKIIVRQWADTPVQHWNIVPYNSYVPQK